MTRSADAVSRFWLTRRGLLGGVAGVAMAEVLLHRANAQTCIATPEVVGAPNAGNGSARQPYKLVLFSHVPNLPDLNVIVDALNTQISRDFSRYWGIYGEVGLLQNQLDSSTWPIEIVEPGGICNRLDSMHAVEDPCHPNHPGPHGFVIFDPQNPDTLAHAVSHECLEMLANPYLCAVHAQPSQIPTQGNVKYIQEVCDPVWPLNFGYSIDPANNGPIVSDFVTPNYFDASQKSTPGAIFSFQGHVTQPLVPILSGYQDWVELDMKQWWTGTQTKDGMVVCSKLVPTAACLADQTC